MSRTLVEVHIGDGGIGLIVPWMDLARMDWWEYLEPLAELVAAEHPNVEWMFTPIADEETDKGALLGY